MTPQIESYRFGHIVIDGQSYTDDVIILPDRVIGDWWRREGHSLHIEDLQAVLEARPEVLIVGRGSFNRMAVPPEIQQALQVRGIELIAESSGEACQTYNALRSQRVVAAALHLTC